VRIDLHEGHTIDSEDTAREIENWADIIFCEWALGNAVLYSRHKRSGQLLLVRLHLQEWQDRDRISYIYDINWEKVDRLLLGSSYIYDQVASEFPVLYSDRTCLVNLPIDASGKWGCPKTTGAEFNLGIVGIVPQRKRIDLAVEILRLILVEDPRYKLHIQSRRPEEYPWIVARKDETAWYERVYQ
jgi:hypothetical protein